MSSVRFILLLAFIMLSPLYAKRSLFGVPKRRRAALPKGDAVILGEREADGVHGQRSSAEEPLSVAVLKSKESTSSFVPISFVAVISACIVGAFARVARAEPPPPQQKQYSGSMLMPPSFRTMLVLFVGIILGMALIGSAIIGCVYYDPECRHEIWVGLSAIKQPEMSHGSRHQQALTALSPLYLTYSITKRR